MRKSHKGRHSEILKSIKKNTKKILPTVNKGLTKIGDTAKNVGKISVPIIEKGASVIYGTMATGLDLGVKGIKSASKEISKRYNSKISRTRSRSHSRIL
jgi:hypothetical protein